MTDNSYEITDSMKELVIARIEAKMSKNLRLSVGAIGTPLSKEELIEHVKKLDGVGKQIIMVHMNFIKAQATGQITSALASI